jgi:hypothetical protein
MTVLQKFFILLLLGIFINRTIQGQIPFDTLKSSIEKVNKTLPKRIDAYTRMDSIHAIRPDLVHYYGTISNMNLTDERIFQLKQFQESRILHAIQTEDRFKVFRDSKVKVIYEYNDSNGVFLFSFLLTPDKYLKK